MKNPIVWAEIPVSNLERAIEFYNTAFGWELSPLSMGPLKMAVLPSQELSKEGISGALVYHESAYKVSDDDSGSLIYLHTDNIDEQLRDIESAGGEIIMPRKLISEDYGSMALFRDSEQNRMALFSQER